MTITHVSDTARWVAVYRAMESDRPDALFRDPFARRLAGPEGGRIVRKMPQGRSMAWAMIIRTVAFDELLLGAIARGGKPLVTISGHAIIQALDDQDLAESRRLLILPMPTPGANKIAMPALAKMRVELGEVNQTKWRGLEGLKAKGGVLAYDEEQSLNMILAAPPREFDEAVREVEGFVGMR